MSPVQMFGNFDFMSEPIGDFQGICETDSTTYTERMMKKMTNVYRQLTAPKNDSKELVDSRDHDLHYLYNRVVSQGTVEAIEEMENELAHRKFVDFLFEQPHFDDAANAPENPQNFDCLRMMVGGVEEMCGDWSAYSLKYVRKLANVCDTKTPEEISDIYVKIGQTCGAI